MNKEVIRTLTPALRQYRKQTEDKFVGAYECEVADRIVSELEAELQSLRAYNDELLDQLERFGIPCPPTPVKESNNE